MFPGVRTFGAKICCAQNGRCVRCKKGMGFVHTVTVHTCAHSIVHSFVAFSDCAHRLRTLFGVLQDECECEKHKVVSVLSVLFCFLFAGWPSKSIILFPVRRLGLRIHIHLLKYISLLSIFQEVWISTYLPTYACPCVLSKKNIVEAQLLFLATILFLDGDQSRGFGSPQDTKFPRSLVSLHTHTTA